MGPKLKELESPSAGTGLETPGQQCPPNERIWETGRTTANGFLTAGVGSSQGGNISSFMERAKSTATIADISSTAATPEKRRRKTSSEQNKQFDPGGKRKEGTALERGCNSTFFFWGELGGSLLVFVFSVYALSVLCLCFVF